MGVKTNSAPVAEYRCPGQRYAISRAVHLGRLARFYPACRQCPHRDEMGTLGPRQLARLRETQRRPTRRSLFGEEGVSGVVGNELTATVARDLAAAFGVFLGQKRGQSPFSRVVLASDGRPLTAELVAAVGEGLRWAGCHLIDIGPASAACLMLLMAQTQANGGILLGNGAGGPHAAAMKLWAEGLAPLSAGDSLETIERLYQQGVDRPARVYGSLRRLPAEGPYLATLSEHYHGLRPLRFVFDCPCVPVLGYWENLSQQTACRIVPCRTTPGRLPEQVVTDAADFGVRIDDDGERCQLWDEQGRAVCPEQLLVLIAQRALAEGTQPTILLREDVSPEVIGQIEALGARVVRCAGRRAEMAAAMRQHQAHFGGGRDGRFWHTFEAVPLPDALRSLTLLLVILSQSDRRFSEILDRGARAS